MQCTSDRSYVGFFPRFMAYIIDLLCVGILSSTVATISTILKAFGMENVINKGILFQYSVIAILTYIVKKLYFVILDTCSGQTLGKMCFRIKVVNEDGGKVTLWNALYRETIGRFLTEVVYFLGYIGVFADREKRAIHDWLCDTRVIYDTNINNEPLYNRQLVPVKRQVSVTSNMQVNTPTNNLDNMAAVIPNVSPQNNVVNNMNNVQQANNPFYIPSTDNEYITNDMVQKKENEIKDVYNEMLIQENIEQNAEKNIVEISEQNAEEENVVEELLHDVKLEMPKQEVKEESLIIEDNSLPETDNQVNAMSVEAEEKKDIASAYGKDLDYSTEFVIDEEDDDISYDTKELDELLDKLNGKNEDN